ncbi:transglycosylase [Mycolicibacterium cyprinidarum]|uniref:Transglycosylase n=1 Tax=Mycolicibacterium cyprinidarum TaxID=2860311 RepID=A0ABQ4VD09_9MYCO|nr:transglycosylase [Mycolicibacterium sp. NGTWS1803]GJF12920.1 transglycosylase [Mycolicibacterium sp. NGTWS0302]GJF20060.1 transglycosylase [Mycolicibacterium sp. NGTWSNA01]
MIGTIIGAIVVGLVVGVLARMVMPGKQNIGVIMTVLLGAAGSFVGTWLTYKLGYSNANGGFEIIPFLVGIIIAVLLIGAYLGITGRRNATR